MPSARPVVRRPALLPGVRVLRRDAATVQVGLDPDHAVVLPEEPAVRESLAALTREDPSAPMDETVLDRLRDRGLLAPTVTATVRLHEACDVDLAALVLRAGVHADDGAPVTLLAVEGEPDRELLDPLVRAGTTHLVARLTDGAATIGPFVDPSRTACLRCLDRHQATRDPRWPLLVVQQGSPDPGPTAAAQRLLLAGWVASDLCTYAAGGRPSTWSTVVRLSADLAAARATHWAQHPSCGCGWDGPAGAVASPVEPLAGSATMAT